MRKACDQWQWSRHQLAINLSLVWWGLPHRKFGKCGPIGMKNQVVFLCIFEIHEPTALQKCNIHWVFWFLVHKLKYRFLNFKCLRLANFSIFNCWNCFRHQPRGGGRQLMAPPAPLKKRQFYITCPVGIGFGGMNFKMHPNHSVKLPKNLLLSSPPPPLQLLPKYTGRDGIGAFSHISKFGSKCQTFLVL